VIVFETNIVDEIYDLLNDIEIRTSISKHANNVTKEGNLVLDNGRLARVMLHAYELSGYQEDSQHRSEGNEHILVLPDGVHSYQLVIHQGVIVATCCVLWQRVPIFCSASTKFTSTVLYT
jgi:hypothetical protein